MFWDMTAGLYELFENYYNGDVNRELVIKVADLIDDQDVVLECACGTGMISRGMAPKCKLLVATDFSNGMLSQAKKNCAHMSNVKIRRANIMDIKCKDESFDKVVAGNVVHLLDQPGKAIEELLRVCKKGGKVIIPTYVNNENSGKTSLFIQALEVFGAGFKKQFDFESYKDFFAEEGYNEAEYLLVEGKMPCAIAILTK